MLHAYCAWGYLYSERAVSFCKGRVDGLRGVSRQGEGFSSHSRLKLSTFVDSSHPWRQNMG